MQPKSDCRYYKESFPNTEFKYVDSKSTEGKEMIEKYQLKYAPSVVFIGEVEKTFAWETQTRLRGAFKNLGSGAYRLSDESIGATHLISEEERKKALEAIGVVTGDNKPQIDFFVMSYCPFGNQAEEAIEPVYKALGDAAEFNPHYVIYSNYQGGGPKYCLDAESKYCSMHGVQELNQGIRELCVDRLYGIEKYFEFTLAMNTACDSNNADTCWQAVAEGISGIDTAEITKCEEEDAMEILAEELALGTQLNVRGSPTVFIDGQPFSGARTPAGFQGSLCTAFEDAPSACDTVNNAEVSAPQTGSC